MSEYNNMHNALKEFLQYANFLADNWDNEYPTVFKNYPKYLPSFDEFIADFGKLVADTNSKEFEQWKREIK